MVLISEIGNVNVGRIILFFRYINLKIITQIPNKNKKLNQTIKREYCRAPRKYRKMQGTNETNKKNINNK